MTLSIQGTMVRALIPNISVAEGTSTGGVQQMGTSVGILP